MNKCLSIDWLQLNVNSLAGDVILWSPVYEVKLMPYTTRHMKIVEELYIGIDRIATVARVPLSSVIPKDTVLVKFDNHVLYRQNLRGFVDTFLKENSLVFKGISRLDICCDFEKFDNGILPETFIKNVVNSKYIKNRKGKAQVYLTHGKRTVFDYLSFGTKNSAINYYLYNKTKELNEVKMKPHIKEKWAANCFDLDSGRNVWRLEFSIKSVNKDVVCTETGEQFSMKGLDCLNDDQMANLFNLLLNTQFVFYYNGKQKIKSRNKPVKLFSDTFTPWVTTPKTTKKDSTRSDRIFIKKLNQLNDELRQRNDEFNETIGRHLQETFIHSRMLTDWATERGFYKRQKTQIQI